MSIWTNEPLATLYLADERATRELGEQLAGVLQDGGFLGLVGDLGAGKTTLSQGLVARLGPREEASSPTYTLLNEYETEPKVYHFDLYRLESDDDLESVGYWDYAEDPGAIVVVEWLDRVPEAWIGNGMVVRLQHDDAGRMATFYAVGKWIEAVAKLA